MSDYIPPELIRNILARLSVADVVRCTSVCKSWYELITSSDFISLHLNLSVSNTHSSVLVTFTIGNFGNPNEYYFYLISLHLNLSVSNTHSSVLVTFTIGNFGNPNEYYFYRDNETFDKLREVKFPFKLLGIRSVTICGSSNGLFCCLYNKQRVFLWNPSLQRVLSLPNARRISWSARGRCKIGFGFGFGFLPSSNDYKIVGVLYTRYSVGGLIVPPQVEIYDSRTRSWRDADAEFSYVLRDFSSYAVILNGIVHWTAINPYHVGGTFVNLIASFDLVSEKFGALMLPKNMQIKKSCILNLSTLKESLCLIHREYDSCGIYIMKEYGIADSWEKLYDINCKFTPLYFRENGEVLSELSGCRVDDLVSYDPKSNKFMDLGVHEEGQFLFFAYAYVDSLFLI